jgi:selenide,water dikinase
VLAPLSVAATDPNLLVGLQTSDDAAVYKLSDAQAIVQTVDFFPPVVDDPYLYGAIAAANSMSDVFAMGGDVLLGLNIAAFPDNLPLDILTRIFEGGAAKAAEAGMIIAGGHTVTDDEPKYGLVVTGTIDPARILTKAGAQPGDWLFLTKPLGVGVITTTIKQQAADPADADAVIASMLTLNQAASRLIRASGATACTDVTGYGLLGHLTEMAVKSEVGFDLDSLAIPWLPGAMRYAAEGRFPGGSDRNRGYYEPLPECGVSHAAQLDEETIRLLYSPETSGGLLVTIGERDAGALVTAFDEAGLPFWEIGRARAGAGIVVR